MARFDNLALRKFFVEIDGRRYPRDSALINYEEKDFIQQYKGLKMFFHEYIRESLVQHLISYTDMKTKYPIEIIDLRQQTDH